MQNQKIASHLAQVKPIVKKGKRLIFRASIRLKDGSKLLAGDYGLKGFPIWV